MRGDGLLTSGGRRHAEVELPGATVAMARATSEKRQGSRHPHGQHTLVTNLSTASTSFHQ
jgi:hypothetical protein